MSSAGNHGPVAEQAIHDIMCSDKCILNDELRIEAMKVSGCTCIDLSKKVTDKVYTRNGNWCYQGSGHIICEELDICGVWNCNLVDFDCKRNEYFVGYGDDCSFAGTKRKMRLVLILIWILLVTVILSPYE